MKEQLNANATKDFHQASETSDLSKVGAADLHAQGATALNRIMQAGAPTIAVPKHDNCELLYEPIFGHEKHKTHICKGIEYPITETLKVLTRTYYHLEKTLMLGWVDGWVRADDVNVK